MDVPTVEEVFDKPYSLSGPSPDLPLAWDANLSIAAELADRECARLLVNCCCFDPPIQDAEIRAYANRFNMPMREAEIEIRRRRDAAN